MENSGLMTASTYNKRNNAAEVLRRKQAAEKEQEMKLQQKIKEKEEKLKRAAETKDQELREKTRKMHEKELKRQKQVLDRRAAQLEQNRTKKMEILTKAHAATSRLSIEKSINGTPQQKKVYAFGSSTPRDLVYLEKLSREQKVYNIKLSVPSPSSGKSSQGHSNASSPNKISIKSNSAFGNNMTSSLYVPSNQRILPIQRSPLNPVPLRKGPSVNATPIKNAYVPPVPRRITTRLSNSMTQSMYTPKPSVSTRSSTTIKANGMLNGLNQKPNVTSTSNKNTLKVLPLQQPKRIQQNNQDVKKIKSQTIKPKTQDNTIQDTEKIHLNVNEEFHSVEKDIYLEASNSLHESNVEKSIEDSPSVHVVYKITMIPEVVNNSEESLLQIVVGNVDSTATVPETLKLPEKVPILEDETSPEPVGTSEENKFDSGVDSETPNDIEQITRSSIGVTSLTSAIAQLSIRTPVQKKSSDQVSTLPHSSSSSSSSNEDLACINQMKNELKARIQKEKEERENRSARIKALLNKARGPENSDSATTGNSTPAQTSTSPILNNDKKLEDDTIKVPATSDLGLSISAAKTLEKYRKKKELNFEVSSATSTPVVEKSIAEELSSLGVNLPGQPTYDYPPEDPKVNGTTFTSQTAAST